MKLETSTVASVLASFAEQEFCANKAVIQKWIQAQRTAIEANESGIKKDLLVLLNNIEQDLYVAVEQISGCPDPAK